MREEKLRVPFFETLLFEKISLFVSGLFLAFFIIFDVFFGKRMLMLSIQLSIRMQRVTLYVPAFIFSHVIMYLIIAYFLIVFFLRRNKVGNAGHFAAFFVLMYLSNLLKLIYADPRPSFLSTELKSAPYYCEKDYGKPSGHAMISSGVLMFIYDDLASNHFKSWLRYFVFILCMITIVVMCFSRLYFGVHSFNQVILGFLWGVFVFFTINKNYDLLAKYIYRPALTKTSSDKMKRQFLIFVPCVLLIKVGLMLLFWGLNIGKETVSGDMFGPAVSCLDAANSLTSGFSTKIASDGFLGLFFLSFFYGLHFSHFEPASGLRLVYDRVWYWIIARFAVLILLVAPMILAKLPHSNIPVLDVLRPAVIIPLFAVLSGKFYLTVLHYLKIPFKQ